MLPLSNMAMHLTRQRRFSVLSEFISYGFLQAGDGQRSPDKARYSYG